MKLSLKTKLIALAAALLAVGGAALAQAPVSLLTSLLATDAIQVYRYTTANIVYTNPGAISAVTNTTKVSPGQAALGGTGYSNTFGNLQGYLVFVLPGTMPYSYVTLAASPADGQKSCLFSGGGAITFLYVSANTSQSINNAVTTLSSNSGACYTYSLSNLTWDRS